MQAEQVDSVTLSRGAWAGAPSFSRRVRSIAQNRNRSAAAAAHVGAPKSQNLPTPEVTPPLHEAPRNACRRAQGRSWRAISLSVRDKLSESLVRMSDRPHLGD